MEWRRKMSKKEKEKEEKRGLGGKTVKQDREEGRSCKQKWSEYRRKEKKKKKNSSSRNKYWSKDIKCSSRHNFS